MTTLASLPALLAALDADAVSGWSDIEPLIEHADPAVSGLADILLALYETVERNDGRIDAEEARRCGWSSLIPLYEAGVLSTFDDSEPRWFIEFAPLRSVLEAA